MERQTPLIREDFDMYPPLPLWRKVVYSLTGVSRGIVWAILQLYFPTFLLEVVQLNWYGVMAVIVLKQLVDGVTDPLVGRLSDHTHTHLGRRKPWTLTFATPALGLWLLLWYSPGYLLDETEVWRTIYYTSLVILWSFCYTCMNMPLHALVPDAAPTYDERTSVTVYVEFGSKVGSCISSFLWTTLITLFTATGHDAMGESESQYDYVEGYIWASLITGPCIVLAAIVGSFGVPERPVELVKRPRLFYSSEESDREGERSSFISEPGTKSSDDCLAAAAQREGIYGMVADFLIDVKDLMTFPPFLVVALMNMFGLLSVTFFVNYYYLYMKYVVSVENQSNWVLLALQLSLISSLVFWGALAHFIPKRTVFLVGCVPWVVANFIFFFIPENDVWAVYLSVIVRGFAAGVAHLIPQAMLPDVIRLDELRSGRRREGLFYSLFLFLLKVAMAFSQSMAVLALGLAGYVPPVRDNDFEYPADQPDAVIWVLRSVMSWVPSLFTIIAMVAAWRYRKVIDEAQLQLNLYS